MKRTPLPVEVRCRFSKAVNVEPTMEIFGRYKLSEVQQNCRDGFEKVLTFIEPMDKNYANIQEEARMILEVLGVAMGAAVTITAVTINGVDVTSTSTPALPPYLTAHAESDSQSIPPEILQFHSLPLPVLEQFLRASRSYSLAVAATTLDQSLSFLLLVTSLECLSTLEEFCPNAELDRSKKSTERYVRLVKDFCNPRDDLLPPDGESGFIVNLKTVYYSHRSAFVHAGREVSIASKIADHHGFQSLGHIQGGKDVRTPALGWFFSVAQRTLLGFAARFPKANLLSSGTSVADIARERGIIKMRWEPK